jgi:hypothetical protein
MTAVELVTTLWARGIKLVASDDKLRYCPRDALTQNLLRELTARKEEVLALLRASVQTIECPGDNCVEPIVLIQGRGWCKNHKIAIVVHCQQQR